MHIVCLITLLCFDWSLSHVDTSRISWIVNLWAFPDSCLTADPREDVIGKSAELSYANVQREWRCRKHKMEKNSRKSWTEFESSPRTMQLREDVRRTFWEIFVDGRTFDHDAWFKLGNVQSMQWRYLRIRKWREKSGSASKNCLEEDKSWILKWRSVWWNEWCSSCYTPTGSVLTLSRITNGCLKA